ncbi:hypothetical protein ASPTUDRAFT_874903 [Aspergillus tubingensis CBS 134.48]|uniref:Uncharacterized protein n=1 Tax=Aspergillus tubingensis (strain CBS 134.48) TaxID=767770 RepID=A0A1L9MUI5_ASPTC|nr:hypothetical protein ASPTUDRAFT_874903 [Aspergillus tubingensis CBS 134.48]
MQHPSFNGILQPPTCSLRLFDTTPISYQGNDRQTFSQMMQANVTVGDLTFRENIYGARFLLLLYSSNGGSPKKVVDRNQYVVEFPLVSTQMRLGALESHPSVLTSDTQVCHVSQLDKSVTQGDTSPLYLHVSCRTHLRQRL